MQNRRLGLEVQRLLVLTWVHFSQLLNSIRSFRAKIPMRQEVNANNRWERNGHFSQNIRNLMKGRNLQHVAKFCDRAEFRDYVEKLVGTQFLPEAFYLSSTVFEIPWKDFPKEFVAKVTHGSGGLIGVWSGVSENISLPNATNVPPWQRYWIHPDRLVESHAASLLKVSLDSNYAYRPGKLFEAGYVNARAQVLVEELLLMPNQELATQTAIYCFNGVPKFIRLSMRDQNQSRSFAWRNIDWTVLPFFQVSRQRPNLEASAINKPSLLNDMIEIASILSRGLDFARVDLYDLINRVVVGEVTIYPSGGNCFFVPLKYNKLVSNFWEPNVN